MLSKALFKSKIFWLAFLGFVFSLVGGWTNKTIDPGTAAEIVNLDWSNILQAAISAAVIIARAFFTNTKISGLV